MTLSLRFPPNKKALHHLWDLATDRYVNPRIRLVAAKTIIETICPQYRPVKNNDDETSGSTPQINTPPANVPHA